MKKYIATDWSIRKNAKYLLLMFVLCGLIPHLILSLLQLASTSDSWSPAEIESYSNFFVCQWTPFWLTLLSYSRLQKMDNFSLIPAIFAFAILLTYLPRFEHRSVMTIALTIPLILTVESSGLMKQAESAKCKILREIVANRSVLRAFYFWSVAFLCIVHISCKACTYPTTIVSPFQMLPVPGILLFEVFRHQQNQAPTIWAFSAMAAAVPLSLFLAAIGSMATFKVYHLMNLGIGYIVLFMLMAVYHIDNWKKAN